MSYKETKKGEILNYVVDTTITPVADAADLAKNLIVELATGDHEVKAANAAADVLHGVSYCGGDAGERIDVQVSGVAEIKLGGTVAKGALITAKADGTGVVAASGNQVIGQALEAGVENQVIPVLIQKSVAA